MHRLARVLIAASAAAMLLVSMSAQAAAPAGGTLSKSKRSVTWNGGPFTTSYPITSVSPCLGSTDTMCDHFLLKVNMGDGAKIKVSIVPSSSGLEVLQVVAGPNDYDLYIFDPQGNEVGESAGSTGRESVTFTHKARFRNQAYDVRVIPFLLVPGATYKGTAAALTFVK